MPCRRLIDCRHIALDSVLLPGRSRRRAAILSPLRLLVITLLFVVISISHAPAAVVPGLARDGNAPAEAVAGVDVKARDLAAKLFDLSSLRQRVQRLPPQVARLLDAHWYSIPENIRAAMGTVLLEAYDENLLAGVARDHLGESVATLEKTVEKEAGGAESVGGGAQMARTLEWLSSPQAFEIKFAEAMTWGDPRRGRVEFSARFVELDQGSVAPERLAIVRRIMKASGSLEWALDHVAQMGLAVAQIVERGRPQPSRRGSSELWKIIARERAAEGLAEQYEPVVTAALLARYSDVDDVDLAAYADFCESPAGRWFNHALDEALQAAIVEGRRRLDAALSGVGASSMALPAQDLVTLDSGTEIRVLWVGPLESGTNSIPGLRYQTPTDLDDLALLSAEAVELWRHISSDDISRGVSQVVIEAARPADGLAFSQSGFRRFTLRRNEDGAWFGESQLGLQEEPLLRAAMEAQRRSYIGFPP